jgi:hypothetical protein
MTKSWLVVFPSLSDISPNTMLDCIQAKIPFVSSREIGFDWLKKDIVLFDPQKIEEITKCLQDLADKDNYINYCQRIRSLNYGYSYSEAALDTIKIFQS